MTAPTTPLWSSAEALAATGGRLEGPAWACTGISIDSRSLQPGDLFVAIKGPKFDGHDFVAAALAAGACAAMIHRDCAGLPKNASLLRVEDTLAALTRMGVVARDRAPAMRIAVTGSVGKTSSKEALKLCLEPSGATYATAGSFNNHWGVPLSLARMPRDTRFGIFELGMNHAGEIGPLSRMVRPQIAIITTIAPVHLEFFASVEAIADAKAEIFEGMDANGVAILNRDNAHFARLAARAKAQGLTRIVGFGRAAQAEARLLDCSLHQRSSAVSAAILGQRLDYAIGAPGEHFVLNSLAVLAAVKAAGGDLDQAAQALAQQRPLKGRGERSWVQLPAGRIELIDESYNASPTSMRAALALLGHAEPQMGGRRIAILGDMRELGAASAQLHAELAPDLEAAKVDLAFTVGPHMAALAAAISPARRGRHAPDSATMLPIAIAALKPGDVVLVKGSLGTRMAPIVDAIKALADKALLGASASRSAA